MKKRNKYRLIYSWLLLLFFAAGQTIVYAHQHKTFSGSAFEKHSSAKQILTEKCQLCDAMHSSHMDVVKQAITGPAQAVNRLYVQDRYDFVSISLILAGGRSPPVS